MKRIIIGIAILTAGVYFINPYIQSMQERKFPLLNNKLVATLDNTFIPKSRFSRYFVNFNRDIKTDPNQFGGKTDVVVSPHHGIVIQGAYMSIKRLPYGSTLTVKQAVSKLMAGRIFHVTKIHNNEVYFTLRQDRSIKCKFMFNESETQQIIYSFYLLCAMKSGDKSASIKTEEKMEKFISSITYQ